MEHVNISRGLTIISPTLSSGEKSTTDLLNNVLLEGETEGFMFETQCFLNV